MDSADIDVPEWRVRADFSEGRSPGDVQSPTLPLPPPKTADEMHDYIVAVANAPDSDRPRIREMVAAVEDRSGMAALLHEQLYVDHGGDVGYQYIALSLIGSLEHESSIEVLEDFIWADTSDGDRGAADPGSSASMFDPHAPLQPRAAEMLVWIVKWDLARLLRIIDSHPRRSVRFATIDAMSYQARGDDARLEELRGLVQREDIGAVATPRRSEHDTPESFEQAVAAHNERTGSAPPPPPEPAEPGRDSPPHEEGETDVH